MFLLIITVCLHCVCLTTVTHTHTGTVHVIRVCLSGSSHEDTLLLHRDLRPTNACTVLCVCVCARCTDHCFLDVCGRFFLGFPASSTDLGAHFCSLLASSLSWQRVPVQLCSCDPSPTALWSSSSGWQGGEVCQAELFAAQISEHPCVSQEVAPLSPLSFP